MSQPKQPSATFGHANRSITVTMIEPKINANGKPTLNELNHIYRRINPVSNTTTKPQRVKVVGYFVPASFRVTGWIHPIEFRTMFNVFSSRITIQRITVGTDDTLGILDIDGGQDQVTLTGIPMGKLLAAAVKACVFTAYAKPTRSTVNFLGKTRRFDPTGAPPFMKITDQSDPIEFVSIGGTPTKADTAALLATTLDDRAGVDLLPMSSPAALRRIADLYKFAEQAGRVGRDYKSVADWISDRTGRPATTCQQMISMARDAKLLPKPVTKTKPKRGHK